MTEAAKPVPSATAISGASVAQAAALQASASVGAFSIEDSAADVAPALSKLAGYGKLTAIVLTDATAPTWTLTYAQYLADAPALARLESPFGLIVTGAPASGAARLQADAHVTSFTLADASTTVLSALTKLETDSKLTAVTIPGSPKVVWSISEAVYQSAKALLSRISGPVALHVYAAPVAAAAGLQADARVASFSVVDTSQDIGAALGALASDGKLMTLAASDAQSAPPDLTYSQYLADQPALKAISGAFDVEVSGATVSQAAALKSAARVSGFSIADSAAHVASALTALNGEARLASITLSDAGDPTISLSYPQYLLSQTALGKIATPHQVALTDVPIADAASFVGDTALSSVTVAGGSANDVVSGSLDGAGDPGLMFIDPVSDLVESWSLDGDDIVGGAIVGAGDKTLSFLGAGDFSDDGQLDMLWRTRSGVIEEWRTNGSTAFSVAQIGVLDSSWQCLGVGDVGGEGDDDILWRNSSGLMYLWSMNGAQIVHSYALASLDSSWKVLAMGQFGGAGQGDILLQYSSGLIYEWQIKDGEIAASGGIGVLGSEWTFVTAGDFGGAGVRDIVWRDTSGEIYEWQMNGEAIVASGALGVLDSHWTLFASGSFGAPGTGDLIWRNKLDGALIDWRIQGDTVIAKVPLTVRTGSDAP